MEKTPKKRKIIKIGKNKFLLINFTEPLRENSEVFPGDPKLEKRIFFSMENDNCRYNVICVGDHIFHPHGDAPNHQNPQYSDRGFDFWNLDYVFNKASLIDLAGSKNSETVDGISFLKKITDKHILPYFKQIKNKRALIIRTGYDRVIEANKKHLPENIPYLDESAVDCLSQLKKLRVIGIDSLSVDGLRKNYAHQAFKNKLIIESLVNLYGMPKKYSHDFFLQASPIAIVGATGGPILSYGYIPL